MLILCISFCVYIIVCVYVYLVVFVVFFIFCSLFLQYFDTVGWVFWPVKTVSHITYTVLAKTLLTHSLDWFNYSDIQTLRSVSSHEVYVPRHRLSTYGRRAFAIAGPAVWNSLTEDMWIRRLLRTVTGSHWRRFYFRSTSVFSALKVFLRECAI